MPNTALSEKSPADSTAPAEEEPAKDRPAADAVPESWVEAMPEAVRPYLRLARWDRPVGFWLLALPAFVGVMMGRADGTLQLADLGWLLVMALGAAAMRGAGCTYNDIVDRDLDAQVARTADRPLPAGVVSVRQAWVFLAAQLAVAFVMFLLLPGVAKLVALGALPLAGAYPFMKRITFAPQAWLGLAMSWGVLVGYATVSGGVDLPVLLMFAGLWAWTFGYDTLYAHMDKADDALIGVGSTARLFGDASRVAVGVSYAAATVLAAAALWLGESTRAVAAIAAVTALLGFGLPLLHQVQHADFDDPQSCLAWFRANTVAGWRLFWAAALGAFLASLL